MENKPMPFEFGISRILDCGFMIEEAISPEPGKIKLGYGMNFLFSVEESWIQFTIRADFKHANIEESFLTGTVLTRFNVNNLAGFVSHDNKVEFPDGSLEALFGVAFGHMRAILSKNVAASRFSHIIVPVVQPAHLFNELLKINIEKYKVFLESVSSPNRATDDVQNFELKGSPAPKSEQNSKRKKPTKDSLADMNAEHIIQSIKAKNRMHIGDPNAVPKK